MSGQKIPPVSAGGSQPSGGASVQQSWDVAMADFK